MNLYPTSGAPSSDDRELQFEQSKIYITFFGAPLSEVNESHHEQIKLPTSSGPPSNVVKELHHEHEKNSFTVPQTKHSFVSDFI